MSDTLVIQSHAQPLACAWLQPCLDSVKRWAGARQFDYRCYGDELFDWIDPLLADKLQQQKVIATDLARLKLCQHHLQKGYQTVIWCDADFLIFSPQKFVLPDEAYALGREVWIQYDQKSQRKLVSKIKVHNAFLLFRQGNTFLDFYAETATRLLTLNNGSMPAQFIGPKLLTALHNIAQCPVAEQAAMLSPLVIKDIHAGGGQALELFIRKAQQSPCAANLCSSLYQKGDITHAEIEHCIAQLMNTASDVFS